MSHRASPLILRLFFTLSLSAMALALTGCRGDPYNLGPRAPVRGQVLVGDKPLPNGIVTFIPDTARNNKSPHQPSANINDGKYELFTVGEAQAPLGWYKVVVMAYEQDDKGRRPLVPKRLIPAKYEDAKTTPLAVEVVENAPAKAYDLTLSP
jgi:hypothetical protein